MKLPKSRFGTKTQLIEFEGIDGSGKTTALKFLANKLREAGFSVLETREVGNPHLPGAVELRKIVLSPESGLDGKEMELVFGAMRLMNQRWYQKVATSGEYDFILCDRGILSHVAYTDHNVDREFNRSFYENFLFRMTKKPDLVVFLKIDPSVASQRRAARAGVVDVIEAKGDSFQARVADSFNKWSQYLQPLAIARLDAEESLEGVETQLYELAAVLTQQQDVRIAEEEFKKKAAEESKDARP